LTLKGITQYYAFVEERQKVHCLNTLFSKVWQSSWPSNAGDMLFRLGRKMCPDVCHSCISESIEVYAAIVEQKFKLDMQREGCVGSSKSTSPLSSAIQSIELSC
jgi:hypothetical protein